MEVAPLVKLWAHLGSHLNCSEGRVGKDWSKFSQQGMVDQFTKAKEKMLAILTDSFKGTWDQMREVKALTRTLAERIMAFHRFKKKLVEYPRWLTEEGMAEVLGEIGYYWLLKRDAALEETGLQRSEVQRMGPVDIPHLCVEESSMRGCVGFHRLDR